jgi:hypothetical protein
MRGARSKVSELPETKFIVAPPPPPQYAVRSQIMPQEAWNQGRTFGIESYLWNKLLYWSIVELMRVARSPFLVLWWEV